MVIRSDVVGTALEPSTTTVERGRLRFFAQAIGETDQRYVDLRAAKDAGYPDLPVPPTFFFGLRLDQPDPFRWLTGLGIDLRFILHGTQRFDYRRLAFAGDELLLEPRITDVYERRNGALEFIVLDTAVSRAGDPIASIIETIVVRHPEVEVA